MQLDIITKLVIDAVERRVRNVGREAFGEGAGHMAGLSVSLAQRGGMAKAEYLELLDRLWDAGLATRAAKASGEGGA